MPVAKRAKHPHVHVHSSGRYSRSAEQATAGLSRYLTRDKADVVTLTEQGNHRHRSVLKAVCKAHGYTPWQGPGGQDDCVVVLKDSRFKKVEVWHDQLTSMPQNRATGGPIHQAITVLMQDMLNGELILYTAAHLTANVEGDWSSRHPSYRARVWSAAVLRWRRLTRMRRRRYKARVVVVADWNLNLEKERFRALLKTLYPRLTLSWKRYPGPGTHGGRVIDATLTNMVVLQNARLLPDDDSSDHRPYIETLA